MRRHAFIWTFVAFLIHVPVCLAYEYALRCPEENERRLRARQICSNLHKNDIANYACLFDINHDKSKESCDRIADYATPGERYVISGGRTTSPCQSGRYQPFALWANVSSKCLFVKSLCEEEGQVKALQVHSLSDQSCLCDFGHGYHFISKPLDLCSCLPSVEDCSCYFDPQQQLTHEENGCIQKYPAISTSQSFEKTSIASNLSIESMDVDTSAWIPGVMLPCTIVIIVITGLILSCNKQKKHKLRQEFTVAIDLGTTSSVYAYCRTTTPKTTDIILNKQWETYSRGLQSSKTPTCILLDKRMHALCIGYEARKDYSDYFCDGVADDYYFVDRFKMELYRTGSEITEHLKINDVKGRQVSAMEVFSQMLIKLKDRIMQTDIQEDSLNVDIKWVLSIPAVWTDRAEHFMRTCAREAGISDDKLNVVVESESASVYIHYLLKENLLISSIRGLPRRYLVIDLGGGTDDITAHTVTPSGKLQALCKPSGGNNGGKKVDAELWSLFENLLGTQVMNDLKQEGSYMEFIEEVENMNNLISAETKNTKLNCKFPLHLLNSLCLKYHDNRFQELLEHSELHNKISIVNERLRIDRDLLVEIITKVANNIVEDIKLVIRKAACEIDNFILVGGFSNSEVVRDKIKGHFPSVNVLYPPVDVELSVVKGAVLYGLNPNYIKSCSQKYYNF